eukprot:scaffold31_cov334-Pavlova_lutheri.AAC.55
MGMHAPGSSSLLQTCIRCFAKLSTVSTRAAIHPCMHPMGGCLEGGAWAWRRSTFDAKESKGRS